MLVMADETEQQLMPRADLLALEMASMTRPVRFLLEKQFHLDDISIYRSLKEG